MPDHGLGDHNFCRNPGVINTIFCFTDDPNKEYEECYPLIVATLIKSNFADVEEGWLPTDSNFKFSDNYFDTKDGNKYGEIMFGEFLH